MEKINKFGVIIPEKITISFFKTIEEIERSELFLMMYVLGNEYLKKNKDTVTQGLEGMYEGQHPNPITEMINSEKINKLFDIQTFEIFYGQMCFARTIDNVLTYFKEILSEIVLKKPQILKSKETERLDFILNFGTIEELQVAIAEKKIEALFYAGFDKIESFFCERIGVDLFENEEQKKDFNNAILSRNLIVHNRGIVTNEYLKKIKETELIVGEKIHSSYENISKLNISLCNFLVRIDKLLIEKFDLNSYVNK
jgi:hypothetical protein